MESDTYSNVPNHYEKMVHVSGRSVCMLCDACVGVLLCCADVRATRRCTWPAAQGSSPPYR
jgi:hypothetical protein